MLTTPNDTHKIKATVYFTNDSSQTGLLTVSLENWFPNSDYIEFTPEGSTDNQKIDARAIRKYTVGNDTYLLKLLDLNRTGVMHYLFVKRLTAENAKLQLYELHQLRKSTPEGDEDFQYYISLSKKDSYEAIDINGTELLPFDLRMSNYLSDCPELAKKIQNKQKGYNYGIMTFKSQKIEVIKRVVAEYNNCK